MNRRLGILAAAWLIAGAAPGGEGDPASYAMRVAIAPGAGAAMQRLAIPAAVLAAAQTADLADLRVFDARGRAMPMARIGAAAAARRDGLKALPILGAADALAVTGVALRLDGAGRARVAGVTGTPAAPATAPVVLGVLFDARGITGEGQALTLDADVPTAQPVTFAVEASADLRGWRPIGEAVIYRAAPGTAPARLALAGAALGGDYLRVTWRAASRLLSPVTVRGGVLTSSPAAAAASVFVDATPPPLADAHAVTVAVPFRTPVVSLAVVAAGGDLIVPIAVSGRDRAGQAWTPLGDGIATRAGQAIAIDGGWRMLRIVADARSPGFGAAPLLRFGVAPRAILFLAGGVPPYVLAAGRPATTDAYLPVASLAEAAPGPPATATAQAPAGTIRLAAADDPGGVRRQLVLWAILLAATALLGGMAWSLWRRNAPVD